VFQPEIRRLLPAFEFESRPPIVPRKAQVGKIPSKGSNNFGQSPSCGKVVESGTLCRQGLVQNAVPKQQEAFSIHTLYSSLPTTDMSVHRD
jgi:hypothetical protein